MNLNQSPLDFRFWKFHAGVHWLCFTICLTLQPKFAMNAITSREVIHNFSAVAARVAAGEELTVTRYGKPVLKLVQLPSSELSSADQTALINRALSFRMTAPYGKTFERSDAYEA